MPCSGDVKLLVNDIAALRPTIFIAVPRVFDRIYAGVMEQLKGSEPPRPLSADTATRLPCGC